MKKKLLTLIVFVLMLGLSRSNSYASEIVGTQSHSVSWPTAKGDKFQLYFNEVGSKQVNSVRDGLGNNSMGITLSYLRSCTVYSWSLKAHLNGKWDWAIRDSRFTTGGTNCRAVSANVRGATTMNSFEDNDSYMKSRAYNQAQSNQYAVPQQVGGAAIALNLNGFQTPENVLGMTTTNTGMSCSATGTARVWLSNPRNLTVKKYHVVYGTQSGHYEHAVRDIDPNAQTMTIGALNTCAQYYYRVAVVGANRAVYWLPEASMTMWSK